MSPVSFLDTEIKAKYVFSFKSSPSQHLFQNNSTKWGGGPQETHCTVVYGANKEIEKKFVCAKKKLTVEIYSKRKIEWALTFLYYVRFVLSYLKNTFS